MKKDRMAPRKQLAKPSKTQQTNKKTKPNKGKNTKTNKRITAEKRLVKEKIFKETKQVERLRKQAEFFKVIEAYESGTSILGCLGEPHEYSLPPEVLIENRELATAEENYEGKRGRKIAKMGDCGLCLKIFRDITKFKNHMPWHDRLHLFICMFCVLAGRKLINCCFITEDSLMNHKLRYEYTSLGNMTKGTLKNTKTENTPELHVKLAKLMRVAWPVPNGIKFHEKL